MYTKSYIRLRLNVLCKYIKLSVLAKEYGLNQSSLSRFMKNSEHDYQLSLEKANGFYLYVVEALEKMS